MTWTPPVKENLRRQIGKGGQSVIFASHIEGRVVKVYKEDYKGTYNFSKYSAQKMAHRLGISVDIHGYNEDLCEMDMLQGRFMDFPDDPKMVPCSTRNKFCRILSRLHAEGFAHNELTHPNVQWSPACQKILAIDFGKSVDQFDSGFLEAVQNDLLRVYAYLKPQDSGSLIEKYSRIAYINFRRDAEDLRVTRCYLEQLP